MFDLAERPNDSGSLDNVATIYCELVQGAKLDPASLTAVAPLYPLSVVRRVGWLLERVASYADTAALSEPLRDLVASRSVPGRRPVDLLAAGGPRRGPSDATWGLVVNATVEPEL